MIIDLVAGVLAVMSFIVLVVAVVKSVMIEIKLNKEEEKI